MFSNWVRMENSMIKRKKMHQKADRDVNNGGRREVRKFGQGMCKNNMNVLRGR